MVDRKSFVLINENVRRNALEAVRYAAEGHVVTVSPPTRSNEQNAKLHALLSDLARSSVEWAGKRRSLEEWKALIISGHSIATKNGGEVVPGIESEFVSIRESSASMSVPRAASLIEYLLAFCVSNGVELRDTRYGGFYEDTSVASPSADASPAPLTSSQTGDGIDEPSPEAVDPTLSAAGDGGEADGAEQSEARDGPAASYAPSDTLSDEDRKRLLVMARMLVAGIGPLHEDLLQIYDGCMRSVPEPSKAMVAKSKAIAKAARNACSDYAGPDKHTKARALDIIAGVLSVEQKDIAA